MRRFSSATTVAAIIAMIAASDAGLGQTTVRTETVRAPVPVDTQPKPDEPDFTGAVPGRGAQARPDPNASPPEVITDLSRLPPRVARMRERILEAARSGSLDRLVTVMQSNELMPIFSLNDDKDPLAYWKANFPDSNGLEILSTLIEILESGFVHVEQGTPQEIFLWPGFARLPLKDLTPEQKVQLFKIVTGA